MLRSTTPGSYWYLDPRGSRTVAYLDVQDSYNENSTAIDCRLTGCNDSDHNINWLFPTTFLGSDADQHFYVGEATTTLAQMTLIEPMSNPHIKAATDIRIHIDTATTNFRFDQDTTTLTFGGTAAGKVSNPVSYEDNGATLVIPVGTDFDVEDTLTVDGVQAGSFVEVSTTTSNLQLYLGGSVSGTPATYDTSSLRITGTLTLADHTAGQVMNQFAFLNSTDRPMFAFSLAPAAENDTITTLALALSLVHNIDSTNVSNIRLYKDWNGNGTLDAGDTQVGGTGVLTTSGFGGTITFSTSFSATTTTNYLVVADLGDVHYANYLTIGLSANTITVTGDTSSYAPVFLGSVSDAVHRKGNPPETGGSERGGDPTGGASAQGTVYAGGASHGGSETPQNDPGNTIGNEVGFLAPTTVGSQYDEWTNGTNALASDGSYATAASNGLRESYATFGFSIPGSNTVTGIAVKLEASGSTAAGTIEVALSFDGDTSTTTTSYSTGVLTQTDAVYTLGGPADTWGASWTPTYFTNANFRVRIIAHPNSNTVRIDAIQVRPYHQATGGGSGGGGAI
jgi:hypothetical protein